jgi:hypothetical protein
MHEIAAIIFRQFRLGDVGLWRKQAQYVELDDRVARGRNKFVDCEQVNWL